MFLNEITDCNTFTCLKQQYLDRDIICKSTHPPQVLIINHIKDVGNIFIWESCRVEDILGSPARMGNAERCSTLRECALHLHSQPDVNSRSGLLVRILFQVAPSLGSRKRRRIVGLRLFPRGTARSIAAARLAPEAWLTDQLMGGDGLGGTCCPLLDLTCTC